MTRTVVFAGWGGHNQEAQARHWLEPFSRETGIEVRQETLSGYDELKQQVEAGRTRWDVMVSGNNFGLRRDAPWLEKLPERIWPGPDLLPGQPGAGRQVPVVERQQREQVERAVRLGGDDSQQVRELASHVFDALRLEKVCVVFQRSAQPVAVDRQHEP